MNRFVGIVAALIVCSVARAENPRWEVVLDASIGEAWDAFTTEEGIRSWIAPRAEIDFRIGGLMRTNYDVEAGPDDPSWIETRILAYEPQRVLCWQTAKSPEGFTHADVIERAWSVIRFEPIGPERTRVVLTSCGWGEGEQWDAALAYFEAGNKYLLDRLRASFEGTRDDAMDILAKMSGGTWKHSSDTSGEAFEVVNAIRLGAGEQSFVMAGGQLMEGEMRPYTSSLAWHDPEDGVCRFVSVKHDGSVAGGTIRALDESTLEWDWRAVDAGGAVHPYVVRTALTGEDSYEMTMAIREADGGVREMGRAIRFERVPG